MKVRALPTCRKPVGDGANRTRSITSEYSEIAVLPLAAPGKTREDEGLPRLSPRETRQAAAPRKSNTGYQRVTKVTLGGKIALAASYPIRRYSWKRRAQGGTCRKTPVVSICLV